eukprot:g4931.t1
MAEARVQLQAQQEWLQKQQRQEEAALREQERLRQEQELKAKSVLQEKEDELRMKEAQLHQKQLETEKRLAQQLKQQQEQQQTLQIQQQSWMAEQQRKLLAQQQAKQTELETQFKMQQAALLAEQQASFLRQQQQQQALTDEARARAEAVYRAQLEAASAAPVSHHSSKSASLKQSLFTQRGSSPKHLEKEKEQAALSFDSSPGKLEAVRRILKPSSRFLLGSSVKVRKGEMEDTTDVVMLSNPLAVQAEHETTVKAPPRGGTEKDVKGVVPPTQSLTSIIGQDKDNKANLKKKPREDGHRNRSKARGDQPHDRNRGMSVILLAGPVDGDARSQSVVYCFMCEQQPATVKCITCIQRYGGGQFCATCDARKHKAASRAGHVRAPFQTGGASAHHRTERQQKLSGHPAPPGPPPAVVAFPPPPPPPPPASPVFTPAPPPPAGPPARKEKDDIINRPEKEKTVRDDKPERPGHHANTPSMEFLERQSAIFLSMSNSPKASDGSSKNEEDDDDEDEDEPMPPPPPGPTSVQKSQMPPPPPGGTSTQKIQPPAQIKQREREDAPPPPPSTAHQSNTSSPALASQPQTNISHYKDDSGNIAPRNSRKAAVSIVSSPAILSVEETEDSPDNAAQMPAVLSVEVPAENSSDEEDELPELPPLPAFAHKAKLGPFGHLELPLRKSVWADMTLPPPPPPTSLLDDMLDETSESDSSDED